MAFKLCIRTKHHRKPRLYRRVIFCLIVRSARDRFETSLYVQEAGVVPSNDILASPHRHWSVSGMQLWPAAGQVSLPNRHKQEKFLLQQVTLEGSILLKGSQKQITEVRAFSSLMI